MSRILRILIIAVVGLVLTTPTWAGESEEVQQIRNVFYDIWEGWYVGNPEQIDRHFAEDFVGISAPFNEPQLWTIGLVGLESIKEADKRAVEQAKTWAEHPNWSHGEEVLHVHIKDDRAVAFNQQWSVKPDSTKRETIVIKAQEVVLLAKIKGEWKITTSLWSTKVDQTVWKWDPE